jgi:iron complex transport system ATP-binding protein
MSAAILRARGLAVGYGARRARCEVLRGINLDVRAGELSCVLGPNGIGKSTLLRTLVGLQPPLAGDITIDGESLAAISPSALARRVGVVLTERVVVDTLRAQRVVELGRYAHSGWWGTLGVADRTAIDWAINVVGVAHLMERDFSRLSDGERQRVMIARALAQEPSLLMLDEPTAFLDVTSRVELWGLLRRLASQRQLAVVVSTHDLEHALRTAGTLYLVGSDGATTIGSPADLIASGAVAATFSSPNIRFDPREKTFHFANHDVERTEA